MALHITDPDASVSGVPLPFFDRGSLFDPPGRFPPVQAANGVAECGFGIKRKIKRKRKTFIAN